MKYTCDKCKLNEIKRECRVSGGKLNISFSRSLMRVERIDGYSITTYLDKVIPPRCVCGEKRGRINSLIDAKILLHFLKKSNSSVAEGA